MSKQQTVAERKHVARVAALGCCVCAMLDYEGTPAEIHHLRVGNQGVALRASWLRVIPLCPIHHRQGDGTDTFQGAWGYHVSPETFEALYGHQEEFLRSVLRELGLNPHEAKYQARVLAEELVG